MATARGGVHQGDPVRMLKRLFKDKRLDAVSLEKEKVTIDGTSFDRKMPTGFKARSGTPYNLDSVVVLVTTGLDANVRVRMEAFKKSGANIVSLLDIKVVKEYFFSDAEVAYEPDIVAVAPAEVGVPDVPMDIKDEPAPKADLLRKDVDEVPTDPDKLLGAIKSVEQSLYDHRSILMCTTHDFSDLKAIASKHIEKFNEEAERMERQKLGPGVSKRTGITSTSEVRYNQFEKEEFNKNRLGADVDVNQYGGHTVAEDAAPQPIVPVVEPPAPKRPKQSSDRKSSRDRKRPRHVSADAKGRVVPPKKKIRPIILLPSGSLSVINIDNVKNFLKDGKFMTGEEARRESAHKESIDKHYFYRRFMRDTNPVQYKVTDVVPKNPAEKVAFWNRVVAVVIMGKKWQFKDWPFDGISQGNLVHVFTKLQGFYFHYSKDQVPKEVEKWNVKTIAIDKEKRHKDQQAMRDFWFKLDDFLKKKNVDFQF